MDVLDTASNMNVQDGYSCDVMGQLYQQHLKNGGIERRQERLQESSSARTSLDEAKSPRVTAGIQVGNGIHSLMIRGYLRR
jgi:hypothetical protein